MSYNKPYVWGIASVAALGGLLFGYDWVVIGGAKPFYEAYFGLTSPQLIGWANSCALVGCLLGSLVCSALSDRLGRRKLLVVAASLFAISSTCTGLASSFATFVSWRIIGGIAIGIASNVSPTYIAEISPAPWRGRLVALNQLTIVVGILAAQIVNWSQRLETAGTFWLYGGICLAGLIFIRLRVPETKGKTLEQIEQELTARGGPASSMCLNRACAFQAPDPFAPLPGASRDSRGSKAD